MGQKKKVVHVCKYCGYKGEDVTTPLEGGGWICDECKFKGW